MRARRGAVIRLFVLAALAGVAVTTSAGCGGDSRDAAPPEETETEAAAPPPEPTPPPPTPVPTVPMSWKAAGAFVWHETDIAPEELGRQMREAGFGWVAVFLHDGLTEDPVDGDWVNRFRSASGLAVGGWGALRSEPAHEAALADALLERYGLEFYIANAEAEYFFSGPEGFSPERFGRSRTFVDAFRRLRPELFAGLSSYCRPDLQDLDWGAWSDTGFAFLPQAYVNDFGPEVAPAVCAAAARGAFSPDSVHPTIGMYPGVTKSLPVERYARLLARAETVGFSVYLAETRMTEEGWHALGEAIGTMGIATYAVPS